MAAVVVADDEEGSDFERSYKLWLDRAFYLARKLLHDDDLARDVAQETLTRALVKWDIVRRHGNPEAWIVRTAINVCHEELRRRKRCEQLSDDQQWASMAPPRGDALDDRDAIVEALRELSERQRDVVVWRFIFNSTVKETARELGIIESKVKDATFNGLRKLRRLLGNRFPERWHD